MRLHEITAPSDDDLAALKNRQAALMQQWFEVIKAHPQPSDPDEQAAWREDIERGGLWFKIIRPLNDKIADLEKQAAVARKASVAAMLSANDGFDVRETLYHGSNAEFESFDLAKVRTAAHIYTSPDRATAELYGANVYMVHGRQQPQANLSVEALDSGSSIFRRVYEAGGYDDDMSFDEFVELVTDGQMYQRHASSDFQDDVMETCFGMGYRSVRFTDAKPGGGFSDSVVFKDASDVKIVRRVQ